MLGAAADTSGSGPNNVQYMGIVVGTQQSVSDIIAELECNPTNPDKTSSGRNALCSKLKFDQKENVGFCIKTNKDKITQKFQNKRNQRNTNKKIFNAYNYILLRLIRTKLSDFSTKHKIALDDIKFQCDADCRDFLKNTGLSIADPGDFHVLADLVAWANYTGYKEPEGVISMDLVNEIEEEMKRRL